MLGGTGRFGIIIISMGTYISKLKPANWYLLQKARHDSIVIALTSVNAAVRKVRLAVESLKK